MGDVTIDEDDLSDEYDFMDEEDDTGDRRRRDKEQRRTPNHKYKEMMQKLADRIIDEIVLDLEDLATVSGDLLSALCKSNQALSGREKPERT